MNMSEWMTCTEPWEMLVFLELRASGRKLQLFAAACCRRAWSIGPDRRHVDLVEAAERFANGWLSEAEFKRCREAVIAMSEEIPDEEPWSPSWCLTSATLHARGGGAARYAARFVANGLAVLAGEQESEPWHAALDDEKRHQCEILRDVIGNPFRPFRFDRSWLSHEGRPAQRMAEQIEESGRYDDLRRLADVLEQNGCKDLAVLDHCRRTGEHVRGCWVIDALLDRESAVAIGLTTEEDWCDCDDPASLLHFLRDKGTSQQWRLFEVACCRRIDHLIEDDRCRKAIEVAGRHSAGNASDEELEKARATAQEAEHEAKATEWDTEAQEQFCMTRRYAAVSRDLFVARAVRSAVCRDVRVTDAEPGTFEANYWAPSHVWAAAAVRWDMYAALIGLEDDAEGEETEEGGLGLLMTEHGKLSSGPPGKRIQEAASTARRAELRAQCEILQDLFGDHLGPIGDAGDWLPCGDAATVSEWWCRLPTPRSITIRQEWLEGSGGAVTTLAREILANNRFDRLGLLAKVLERAGCDDPVVLDHLRGPGPHYPGCWVLELLARGEPEKSDAP